MKLTHLLTCLATLSMVAVGCVPEPLEGFGDTGTPSNNANMTNMDAGMGGDTSPTNAMTDNFDPQFRQVAEILRANCGLAACHGPSPNGQFGFITGTNATPGEIRDALSVQTPTGSGNRLIAPNSPFMSEIFVRINLPLGDPQMMGAGSLDTKLSPDQIMTIQTWIENGAVYTQ